MFSVSKMTLIPLSLYFVVFCILTFPLICRFSSHFFCDMGDGLQNVWNMWWVNKAVTQLHTSPWYTTYLHYPYGTSLQGQTLNVFNGFMGIVLLKFMSLVQAHNFIVIFSFVMGGLTAFFLAHYLTESYWGSITAGCVFTFSNYHFAHAEGHLQLVSLEWLPLFMLCVFILINRPSIIMAAASAAALFAVILCDYYYFLFCLISTLLILIWRVMQPGGLAEIVKRSSLVPLVVFAVAVISSSGVIVFALLSLNEYDPLLGAHNPEEFSSDLLAPFIPGGHWRFAELTKAYWSKLPGNIHESSVFVGLAVISLLVWTWVRRNESRVKNVNLWYSLLLIFFVLSLGPVLHIWGVAFPRIIMPYSLCETLLPFLRLSGCPVRMMVMVTLFSAVICAAGFKTFFEGRPGVRMVLISWLLVLVLEYVPKPIPSSQVQVPKYVEVLKGLPDARGVIDLAASESLGLYYQTVHERPMAFGYTSRTPTSVRQRDLEIMALLKLREIGRLRREYKFDYLICVPPNETSEMIYRLP